MRRLPLALVFVLTVFGGCSPAAPTASSPRLPQASEPATPVGAGRTLIIDGRGEPTSMGTRGLRSSFSAPIKLFNATLDYVDEKEGSFPYLAESLPRMNTDSWKINADGTMETTYRLRANLTWHDGEPLTADDFVYAYQFFSNPEMGLSSAQPTASMDHITGPDPRTVVITWKQVYADAAAMDINFQPLPRHMLEPAFQGLDAATITNHPLWTVDYGGLGPYKIDHWEPGASIEGSAFDGHALGRPKIDRVSVRFIPDSNAAVAAMLSGAIHYISDYILWWEDGRTLEQEWPSRGTPGTVLYAPVLLRPTGIQFRPEFVNPTSLLDVRVRKALARAVDSPGILEHILSDDVGVIPVMFDVVVNVQAASLKGPILRKTPDAGISIMKAWTWEWTS